MTTYTAIVQENHEDFDLLYSNNYILQLAKSVLGSGAHPTFNIIFKSIPLAPNMNISWRTQYALNWTTTIPSQGNQLTVMGPWQPCDLGQSFDLGIDGSWTSNQGNPHVDPKSLNIGRNGFSTAVNVVIGVQNPEANGYTPIWVGQHKLLVNAHGDYRPCEAVQLWFSEGQSNGALIQGKATEQSTEAVTFDFGLTPGSTQCYFHYDAAKGVWQYQATPFTDSTPSSAAVESED